MGAETGAVNAADRVSGPDLTALIERWQSLPEPVRAGLERWGELPEPIRAGVVALFSAATKDS